MISTDGRGRAQDEGLPHPRNYGTCPRVLARYVRENPVLTLEEAIRKMTSLPAAVHGISDQRHSGAGYGGGHCPVRSGDGPRPRYVCSAPSVSGWDSLGHRQWDRGGPRWRNDRRAAWKGSARTGLAPRCLIHEESVCNFIKLSIISTGPCTGSENRYPTAANTLHKEKIHAANTFDFGQLLPVYRY